MYDARTMYPSGFHPMDTNRTTAWDKNVKHHTRTQCPVRYYFIDFGLSAQFQDQGEARVNPVRGGDRTAPEHRQELLRSRTPHNPFWTDVYYIGNLVREEFLRVSQLFLDLSYVSLMKLRITLILAL